MRGLILAGAILIAGAAHAQQAEPPPPRECTFDAAGHVDYEACARVAPEGSPLWRLSIINLGTRALERRDYRAAVRYYDLARPADGARLYSDAGFHANRAEAYKHVGRDAEALADARLAVAMITNRPGVPGQVPQEMRLKNVDIAEALTLSSPILKAANDPLFAPGMAAYRGLPAADWMSLAHRGALFAELGDLPGALEANAAALKAQPGHPGLLNNQCYFLTLSDRAVDALPFCQSAMAAAPEEPAIRHSLAVALAKLGLCADAGTELERARSLDPVSVEYRKPLACTPHGR